jgi:LysR family glycine cleavage system transcriptional activator
MPTSHRLPSLEALRYFEVAARYASFTRAAQELCLTQSAVSQKILALEARLGYLLFLRLSRGLRLTDKGQHLYTGVTAAFDLLKNTLSTMQEESIEGTLKVRVMPSFATKWLLPRLSGFITAYPRIRLLIDADLTQPNYKSDEVDVAVTCEWTDNAKLQQQHLFNDISYPVMSPELQHTVALSNYADLARTQLLHDSMPYANYSTNWDAFFTQLGRYDINTSGGSAFSRADLVIQAACAGQGISLARHSLCAQEVAEGRLIRPFPDVMEEGSVYLACPQEYCERPRVAAFISWLGMEALNYLKCRQEQLDSNAWQPKH